MYPTVFINHAAFNAERTVITLDLEADAIFWAINRLREYLRVTNFRVFQAIKLCRTSPKSAITTRVFSDGWSFSRCMRICCTTVQVPPTVTRTCCPGFRNRPRTRTWSRPHFNARRCQAVHDPCERQNALWPRHTRFSFRYLVFPGQGQILQGTSLAPDGFQNLRQYGLRIGNDDPGAPLGDFEARANLCTIRPLRHLSQRQSSLTSPLTASSHRVCGLRYRAKTYPSEPGLLSMARCLPLFACRLAPRTTGCPCLRGRHPKYPPWPTCDAFVSLLADDFTTPPAFSPRNSSARGYGARLHE